MTVTVARELQSVADVTSKLRGLLDHARIVKPETSVEPPLPVAELIHQIGALHDDFPDATDQSYRYATVETASRQLFYSLICSSEIDSPDFVEVWDLLDILLICGDAGKCTPELPCWLIEELLDSQTTHGCRVVFDYLESRRERLAQKDFHKKNLVFLRSCNELLRRLSRAEDAIFCGRVFFFLFQTFPLGDKSSVNLRGEFHVENTTKFEVADGDQMDLDPEPTKNGTETPKASTPQPPTKPGNKAVPIKPPPKKEEEIILTSTELYPLFWRLQQDFSDPTRLFAANNFQRFKKGLDRTISKFKKTPTVVQTQTPNAGKRATKRRLGDDAEPGDANSTDMLLRDNYNPKYLTSRDLFELELSDLAFQRHILVQSLILIDFLLSLTERAKKRLSGLDTTNKSMLYSFTLTEEDSKWATTTRTNITNYLSASSEGRLFNRMVETVLARDKNWIRWKVESCPSIVRDTVTTESEMVARRGIRDATRVRRLQEKPMGTMDMSFLEGYGGGLEDLQDASRYTLPAVQELLEGIKTDDLDRDMAMEDAEIASWENAMANKRWRILRQARADQLSLLDKVEPGKDLDTVFCQPHGALDGSEEADVEDAVEEDGDATDAPEVRLENGDVSVERTATQSDVTQGQDVQMTVESHPKDQESGDSGRPSAAKVDANQDVEVE